MYVSSFPHHSDVVHPQSNAISPAVVNSPPPSSFSWSPQPFSEDEIGGQGRQREVFLSVLSHLVSAISCAGERADLNAQCYDKVALLIGNQRYHHQTLHLNTPENDVQDLAGILRSAGFKVVSLVNLTKSEMKQVRNWALAAVGQVTFSSVVCCRLLTSSCRSSGRMCMPCSSLLAMALSCRT